MDVTIVGDGPVEAAIVGGIHGDEPCGPTAITRFLADTPELQGSVKCIIANEQALAQDVRYIETDLNRAFPGAADSSAHEERLAARLVEEIAGLPTLSFHSTQSTADPFAIFAGDDTQAAQLAVQLPIDHLVDAAAFQDGRFIQQPGVVEVECGRQRSAVAADNAYRVLYAFLRILGLLEGDVAATATDDVYRLTGTVTKDPAQAYSVCVENFTAVPEGAIIARTDDGETKVAEEEFVPVLLSADGYEEILGHTAQQEPRTQYLQDGEVS